MNHNSFLVGLLGPNSAVPAARRTGRGSPVLRAGEPGAPQLPASRLPPASSHQSVSEDEKCTEQRRELSPNVAGTTCEVIVQLDALQQPSLSVDTRAAHQDHSAGREGGGSTVMYERNLSPASAAAAAATSSGRRSATSPTATNATNSFLQPLSRVGVVSPRLVSSVHPLWTMPATIVRGSSLSSLPTGNSTPVAADTTSTPTVADDAPLPSTHVALATNVDEPRARALEGHQEDSIVLEESYSCADVALVPGSVVRRGSCTPPLPSSRQGTPDHHLHHQSGSVPAAATSTTEPSASIQHPSVDACEGAALPNEAKGDEPAAIVSSPGSRSHRRAVVVIHPLDESPQAPQLATLPTQPKGDEDHCDAVAAQVDVPSPSSSSFSPSIRRGPSSGSSAAVSVCVLYCHFCGYAASSCRELELHWIVCEEKMDGVVEALAQHPLCTVLAFPVHSMRAELVKRSRELPAQSPDRANAFANDSRDRGIDEEFVRRFNREALRVSEEPLGWCQGCATHHTLKTLLAHVRDECPRHMKLNETCPIAIERIATWSERLALSAAREAEEFPLRQEAERTKVVLGHFAWGRSTRSASPSNPKTASLASYRR